MLQFGGFFLRITPDRFEVFVEADAQIPVLDFVPSRTVETIARPLSSTTMLFSGSSAARVGPHGSTRAAMLAGLCRASTVCRMSTMGCR